MDNYTMTFYCHDCLSIPPDPRMRQKDLEQQVLQLMQEHRLELVDFNLTQNYHTYPGYERRAADHKTLVEMRLYLTRFDLRSRDAIYNRCLNALQNGELSLSGLEEKDTEGYPVIFIFDNKDQSAAS